MANLRERDGTQVVYLLPLRTGLTPEHLAEWIRFASGEGPEPERLERRPGSE